MGSLVPLAVLISMISFFYYVFMFNPYHVLDYFRITLMGITLVTVFGFLIFMEYYNRPVFEEDSAQEMATNFMRFLYKYGFYLLYFAVASFAMLGVYTLLQKGFVYSSESWVPYGLLFLALAYVNTRIGGRTFQSKGLDFIKNLILYLPCILTDLIRFLKKDYANTPSTSFIVLAILIVYIIVFYLIPFVYQVQYRNDGLQLISHPIRLRDPVSFTSQEINERILKNRPFYDRWFQHVVLQQLDRAEKAPYVNSTETKYKHPWVIPPDEITQAYYQKEGFLSGITSGLTTDIPESEECPTECPDASGTVQQGSDGSAKRVTGITSLENQDKQWIPYEVFKRRVEKEYDTTIPPYERYKEYIMNHPQVVSIQEKFHYMYSVGYAAWDAILYTLPKTPTAKFYYHYSLTAWVYLQKIQSNKYQLIYSFGTRPSLYYDPMESALLVILDYGLASQRILYKTTTVLFQRWNYIVMNYNYGSLDLFINNNLVGTYPGILTVLRDEDVLIVGSRDNKDLGGICNVKYYELPLGLRKMEQIYQRFHRKKIPI